MGEPTIEQRASAVLSEYRGALQDYHREEGRGNTAGRLAEAESLVLRILSLGISQTDDSADPILLTLIRRVVRTEIEDAISDAIEPLIERADTATQLDYLRRQLQREVTRRTPPVAANLD